MGPILRKALRRIACSDVEAGGMPAIGAVDAMAKV
jgi:hypothetical protein